MKKFIVKRSNWIRGTGQGELLSDEGKMCCLGFAVNQICRIPKRELLGISHPVSVLSNFRNTTFTKQSDVGSVPDSKPFVDMAIDVNDNGAISDKTRERLLTKIFRKAGITVTFV